MHCRPLILGVSTVILSASEGFFKLEIRHFVQDDGVEAQGDGQGAGDREYGAPKLKLALDGFVF